MLEARASTREQLVPGLVAALRRDLDLVAREVVVVGRGTLPKTTGGKLQRALVRQRYLDGELGAAPPAHGDSA